MHTIDAIIFDNDGTLVDSEVLSLSTMVEYCAEFGVAIAFEEAIELFAGSDFKHIVRDLEHRRGQALPSDFEQEFRRRQIECLENRLQPIDGARDLLASLTRPFCVASNAPRNKISVCLKTAKLDEFFEDERIFSAYDVQAWKPDPDLFLLAAKTLNCEPSRCAVVEDSIYGVRAGLAAGMQVFAYDPQRRMSLDPTVHVVSHLSGLAEFF